MNVRKIGSSAGKYRSLHWPYIGLPIEYKQNLYLYAAMVLKHLIQMFDINLSEKITVGG
jgi:hypothetical protein